MAHCNRLMRKSFGQANSPASAADIAVLGDLHQALALHSALLLTGIEILCSRLHRRVGPIEELIPLTGALTLTGR